MLYRQRISCLPLEECFCALVLQLDHLKALLKVHAILVLGTDKHIKSTVPYLIFCSHHVSFNGRTQHRN